MKARCADRGGSVNQAKVKMRELTGHIFNPAATKARKPGPAPAGVMARAPEGFAALDAALAEMNEAGVARLIIEGGDGTVREVVSRVLTSWEAPPEFAIIPVGNTNLIARSAGAVKADAMAHVASSPETLRRREIALLKARRAGAPDLRGFIMGAGAYEKATRMAREEIAARHGAQVVAAVFKLLRSPELRAPNPIGFSDEGRDAPPEPRLLTALTSLPGALLLGLSPFWGEGSGAIRWLDIASPAPRLALAAPFIAFGKPVKWMGEAYRSGRTGEAALRPGAPFVMDGEHFEPGEDGLVRVSASETATFLSF